MFFCSFGGSGAAAIGRCAIRARGFNYLGPRKETKRRVPNDKRLTVPACARRRARTRAIAAAPAI